jgi:hypothetical protein
MILRLRYCLDHFYPAARASAGETNRAACPNATSSKPAPQSCAPAEKRRPRGDDLTELRDGAGQGEMT